MELKKEEKMTNSLLILSPLALMSSKIAEKLKKNLLRNLN